MQKHISIYLATLSAFLIFLLISPNVYAQKTIKPKQKCSTKTPAIIKRYAPGDLAKAERSIDYLYVIRVYVHILRNNDGTNAATTETQMYADLQTMSNFFKPHNICFMFVGFEYINNTYLNNSTNPGTPADVAALTANNKHNDAIDIYVHTAMGDGSGGNSYNIPSDFFSVVQSTNFNFYHEMGHCLGLLHTFETALGTECPDASNCSDNGDFICDTQADFAGSENMVNPPVSCTYTGTQSINCNGASRTYSPPINNIMSYWAACYAQFTPQQGTRMRATIVNENIVNKCLVPFNADLYANPANILILNDWHLAAKNEINIGTLVAGSTVRIGGGNNNKVVNAGTKITLRPGTIVSPTNAQTKFMINPLCN